LLQKIGEAQSSGSYDDPVFPTIEEQSRAKEIITNQWDSVVGVTIEKNLPPSVQLKDGGRQAAIPR
jgi:putative spermidine/putrescine transport system substrate-binding protein